jgi:hypothetical protein
MNGKKNKVKKFKKFNALLFEKNALTSFSQICSSFTLSDIQSASQSQRSKAKDSLV